MKKKKTGQERNYGLDLLKIVSILFILVLHYDNKKMGGLLGNVVPSEMTYYIAHYTKAFTIIACNLFVIISGYYLCRDNQIKVRKIVDILLLLVFNGLLIYGGAILLGITHLSRSSFKLMLTTINSRWFINIYLLLYLLHPFINKVIQSISKKQFEFLLLICIFFFSIWSSLIFPEGIIDLYQIVTDSGYGITTFTLLYLIGAYIRYYKDDYHPKSIICFLLYIIISCLNGWISLKYKNVFEYNFFTNIVNTILLFFAFKNLKIKHGKYIPLIASTALAVYIMHENIFIVEYIYQTIFHTPRFYHRKLLLVHMPLTVLILFFVCVGIELCRKWVFKKTMDRWMDQKEVCNKVIEI